MRILRMPIVRISGVICLARRGFAWVQIFYVVRHLLEGSSRHVVNSALGRQVTPRHLTVESVSTAACRADVARCPGSDHKV